MFTIYQAKWGNIVQIPKMPLRKKYSQTLIMMAIFYVRNLDNLRLLAITKCKQTIWCGIKIK